MLHPLIGFIPVVTADWAYDSVKKNWEKTVKC